MDSERFERAVALRDSGKEEDALREFEALANVATEVQEKGSLIGNQATCLWRLGRLQEARQRLSEAARTWTNVFTEFMDACLCVSEGKSDEALRKLTIFLRTHIDLKHSNDQDIYADAQEELGLLLFKLKRYSEAIDPLEAALTLSETDERRRKLCFYLGICRLENGDLEAAEGKLMESLPANCQDPLWAQAQYQLGCLYFKQGAFLNAKKAFELCEFFVDDAETKLKQNISGWLAAIH